LIGVIGPPDSTHLVRAVAPEMGLGETLAITPYKSPDETGSLVHRLGELCPVIVFTGRLPYRMAVSAGFPTAGFEYIPHEGTDLFRILNILALSEHYQGRIPRLSFDSMSESDVAEAYAELGVKYTCHVIPLELPSDAGIDVGRIIAAHMSLYKAAKVEHCATCISSVFAALNAEGLPVTRVSHSRISVRQTLMRAQLLLELDRAEASQTAVGVLRRVAPGTKRGRRAASSLSQTLRLCAHRLGGRVLRGGAQDGCFVTTRGNVDRVLNTMPLMPAKEPLEKGYILGIGTGSTVENAERRARDACERPESEQNVIGLREDLVIPCAVVHAVEARKIRRRNLQRGRDLQVSPTIARRLGLIFRELDAGGFTADEFARSYNVQPRSARRLIALLRARGLVQECGLESGGDGAGRPKYVYRLLLDRLADSDFVR